MIDWIDVAGGVFEMIAISMVVIGFNMDKDLSRERIIIFLIPVLTILPVVNSFDIPYHAFLTVGVEALLAFAILRINIINAITDSISGLACVLIYQLICSVAIFGINQLLPINETILMFVSLTFMDILFWILVNSEQVQRVLSKWYYGNRRIILWIWVTILIVCALVINLWSPEQTVFSNRRVELLILVGLYIFLNSVFVYSLLKKKTTEKELYEAHEYEDYLHELMNQMKSREHEYKNHLQHIISITEAKDVKYKDKRIREYTRQVIESGSGSTQSAVTDSIAISIFLYQVKKRAEEEGVNLEYYTDKPFPEYSIPEKDLVELVSNAINNAFESVAALEPERKSIFILFQEKHIEIINTMPRTSGLTTGVSTKGNDRGYGRLNMYEIARKYDIKLDTEIEEDRFIVDIDFR